MIIAKFHGWSVQLIRWKVTEKVFYNTMLSRMGSIKSGRLEDPESGESLSDVETTLTRLGIALRDSNSEFRNFGDVLDEVGQRWESYSSVNQRAIAQAFAGKLCA